jgi:site-specific DNA-methyltransferase (adenine-specific)
MSAPYYQDEFVTLYHGDCRDVLPTLGAESVTLLWTDPPYGHANMDGDLQSARVGVKGARQRPAEAIANDEAGAMRLVVDEALLLAVPLLRADCCCCCCCCCGGGGPSPTFAWLAERMDRDGLSFFHALIWDKTARGPGMGWRFRRDYEMLMVAHRRGGKLAWANADYATSNIRRSKPVTDRQHPNEKPLSLASDLISLTTLQGDLVLDPFAGSGTSLIAARSLARRAIGIELSEAYCETAAGRLSQNILDFGGAA